MYKPRYYRLRATPFFTTTTTTAATATTTTPSISLGRLFACFALANIWSFGGRGITPFRFFLPCCHIFLDDSSNCSYRESV